MFVVRRFGFAVFRFALERNFSSPRPAIARQPAGVRHRVKLMISQRDHLRAELDTFGLHV